MSTLKCAQEIIEPQLTSLSNMDNFHLDRSCLQPRHTQSRMLTNTSRCYLGNSPCRSDGPLVLEKLEWLDFLTRGDHHDSQSLKDALNVFSEHFACGVRNVLGCQTACYAA